MDQQTAQQQHVLSLIDQLIDADAEQEMEFPENEMDGFERYMALAEIREFIEGAGPDTTFEPQKPCSTPPQGVELGR